MIFVKAALHQACGLLLLFTITGCATAPDFSSSFANTHGLPARAEAHDVPFFPQDRHQCGPAALASMLGWSGVTVTPEQLSPQIYLPEKLGSLQSELLAATRRYGRMPYRISTGMEALLAEVAAGHPVLVLQNLGLAWYPRWHYAVVIAYDLDERSLTLHSGLEAGKVSSMALFEKTWSRTGQWAMVVMPPDRLPVTATETDYLTAISELERLGSWHVSLPAYQGALRQWPASEYAMLGRANSLYHLGRLADAEQAYQAALQAHPTSAVFYNNLAQLLLDQGRLIEATDAARMAVQLGGNHVETYRKTLDAIQEKQPHE